MVVDCKLDVPTLTVESPPGRAWILSMLILENPPTMTLVVDTTLQQLTETTAR